MRQILRSLGKWHAVPADRKGNAMDNKVKVRIYGQDYTISGERDEKTIQEIAAYVDGKMREIGRYFASGAQGSLAVLAAVNVADEFFEQKEEVFDFLRY